LVAELKSFVAVGKKYNVSDNTIRKWIRRYNEIGIQNLDELKDLKISDE
jgi:transposase